MNLHSQTDCPGLESVHSAIMLAASVWQGRILATDKLLDCDPTAKNYCAILPRDGETMTIDLKALSTKQLDTLISKAKKRKINLAKRKPIAPMRRKLTALAKSAGYTIEELFGTGGGTSTAKAPKAASPRKGKKLGKVAPKYRNPANKTDTWTGRGKRPRWLAAEIANGKQLESFLIKKAPASKAAAKKTKARKAAPKKATARKATKRKATKRKTAARKAK